MDSALEELIAHHARRVVVPDRWPTPEPREGQSREAWAADVARLRELHNAAALEGPRLLGMQDPGMTAGSVHYNGIPLHEGTITARVYTPVGKSPFPVIAFLHGGGWWMGGGATGFYLNDALCRALCAGLTAVVVNVDYRLAPEHPYPAQLEDVYQALTWITKNAAELHVDPERLGVLGISSGGNLAASVALLARDRGGPFIRAQFLVTPVLDATASSPLIKEDPGTYASKLLVRELYTHGQAELTLPYISPLHAPVLSGLRPAVITVGQFDPLRDEGKAYSRRLQAASVGVTLLEYPTTHTVGLPEDCKQWQRELLDAAAGLL